jgi:hypothetical protein
MSSLWIFYFDECCDFFFFCFFLKTTQLQENSFEKSSGVKHECLVNNRIVGFYFLLFIFNFYYSTIKLKDKDWNAINYVRIKIRIPHFKKFNKCVSVLIHTRTISSSFIFFSISHFFYNITDHVIFFSLLFTWIWYVKITFFNVWLKC